MARERAEGFTDQNAVVRQKKKVKKKKRPAYCPNSSKNMSYSLNLSERWAKVSKSSLKRNNNELAKTLNKCKLTIARLQQEVQNQNEELFSLQQEYRMKVDNMENEIQRRIKEILLPARESLNGALDNMAGLSVNLVEAMRVVAAPLRMSQAASNSSSRSSLNRNSSLGCKRMRNAAGFVLPRPSSPQKQLPQNKVAPMVAGHAISRPRIHLTRMDLTDHQQLQQQEVENTAVHEPEHQEVEEDIEEEEAEEPEQQEAEPEAENQPPDLLSIANSPAVGPPRRAFNLTIIGEESMQLISPTTPAVPHREQEGSPRTTRNRINAVSSTPDHARSSEVSTRNPGPSAASRLPCPSGQPGLLVSATPPGIEVGTRDAADSPRHIQANSTPSRVEYNGPMSLGTTPRSAPNDNDTSAVEERQPLNTATLEIPENPSDSFFANMEYDPMEGPSWLLDTPDRRKRKKKSAAARKLSTLMSDRPSRSSQRLTGSMETSDLVTDTSTASSEAGLSGYVLAEDLVPAPTEMDIHPTISKFSEKQASISSAASVSPDKRSPLREMRVQPTGRVVTYDPRLDTGLVVERLREARILIQNSPNISELGTPYRLSDVYITSPGRSHSLEEVVSVGLSALSHSQISPTYKECYVRVSKQWSQPPNTGGEETNEHAAEPNHMSDSDDADSISPPRTAATKTKSKSEMHWKRNTATLEVEHEDEAAELSDGLAAKPSRGVVKRKGQSEPGRPIPGVKKKRVGGVTEPSSPAESDKENKDREEEKQQTEEQEGVRRGRRAAAQISFKEPSLRGKMRQGDAGTTSVYSNFVALNKGNKKGKK